MKERRVGMCLVRACRAIVIGGNARTRPRSSTKKKKSKCQKYDA